MSAESSPEKKRRTPEASDLGEMLIDAVSHDDKKLAKTALKLGMCDHWFDAYAFYICVETCRLADPTEY